jgi:hypothetical protein
VNFGIRITSLEARFVMSLDSDIILADDFLAVALACLERRPRSFILCRILDLPQRASLSIDVMELRVASPWNRSGAGRIARFLSRDSRVRRRFPLVGRHGR